MSPQATGSQPAAPRQGPAEGRSSAAESHEPPASEAGRPRQTSLSLRQRLVFSSRSRLARGETSASTSGGGGGGGGCDASAGRSATWRGARAGLSLARLFEAGQRESVSLNSSGSSSAENSSASDMASVSAGPQRAPPEGATECQPAKANADRPAPPSQRLDSSDTDASEPEASADEAERRAADDEQDDWSGESDSNLDSDEEFDLDDQDDELQDGEEDEEEDDEDDDDEDDHDNDDDDDQQDDEGEQQQEYQLPADQTNYPAADVASGSSRASPKRADRKRPTSRRCNCEPLALRIEADGAPVTDVDLVSYRDLCQLEQRALEVRTNRRRGAARSQLAAEAGKCALSGASPAANNSPSGRTSATPSWRPAAVERKSSLSSRRSSLPEESGAYYELCTSGEEQLIRQRFAWHPPSLKRLALVEEFFEHLGAQRVPWAAPAAAGRTAAPASKSKKGKKAQKGSYRDQQIASQLPRQDISLEYCSYKLDERARAAYQAFVERRNSEALAVGRVVQLRLEPAGRDSPTEPLALGQRCRRCLVRFEERQLAVLAPAFHRATEAALALQPAPLHHNKHHKQQVALFHPACFSCATCREFLVDLVHCARDNRLYCLRHYGDSLRPRCARCQELIFADQYLKAMNDSFHLDHFLCRHCHSNLAGQRYVLKEDKPFCIGCYEANFANTCEDCHKRIGIDSRDLSYKERHWHDTCFLCNKCNQSLIDKPFGTKSEKVFCADCYDDTFASRCDACQNPFRAGSKKMEYQGRQWHDSCFCCFVCKNTIGSNSFIPKNDEIYCIKCYEDKYATRCTKCKQVIVAGGVTFRNEPWHRECFNCCNCNKSLAGQRFTTREPSEEAGSGANAVANKCNQPHNAYCIDCYGELFAKKCFACTKAITGLNGTRFVTFEERSWHNDCFTCSDCAGSLVGKGFITDGPDAILCADCARAKLR